MKIQRRDFLKMLGVLGTSLATSNLPVSDEIAKLSDNVLLPDDGTVVTDMSPQISVNAIPGADFRITRLDISEEIPWQQTSSVPITTGSASIVGFPYYAGGSSIMFPAGRMTVKMEATAHCDQVTADALWVWFKENKKLPLWHQEWICLYCGSAQPVHVTSCKNCGGQRNWVVT